MAEFVVMSALFCYRRHGWMGDQLVRTEQVKGEWVVCPRCALGADPDPQCLMEVHYARIMDEKVPTATSTARRFLKDSLRIMAKRTGNSGWGYKAPRIDTARKTLADDTVHDAVRRKQDEDARAAGYRDHDHKKAEAVLRHGLQWVEYVQSIRQEGA